ncbi:MAG: HDOD domain-containing protein [Lacunisphaera sp.]|nr:HDOD domain-containing protein [Lacunisphaera sp.]
MTATPSTLVRAFLATGALPLSRSISQVQGMLQREDYNACDLADYLRTDPTLTARVMAVANSAFFSRQPCAAIEDAVNRLGTLQLTRIFAQVLANASMIRPLAAYGLPADAIWHRSVATAVGAELAAGRQGEDRSAAYMVGLLHLVGMLVVDKLWLRQAGAGRLHHVDIDHEWTADERRLCGFDQATLGGEMLRQLGFPDSVVSTVGRQYRPPLTPTERTFYIGRLVRSSLCAEPHPNPDQEVMREFRLVAESQFEAFLADVREEMQSMLSAV